MPTIIGIDPGNNGGIVVLSHRGGDWHMDRCFKLEHGEQAIVRFLRDELVVDADNTTCYLEKVHGWGTARSFNFGRYYGFVRGAVMMRGIQVVDVLPQAWMKIMGVQGKSQTREKRESMRALAAQAQTDVEATNWNAAAILIARYGVTLYETGEVYDKDRVTR